MGKEFKGKRFIYMILAIVVVAGNVTIWKVLLNRKVEECASKLVKNSITESVEDDEKKESNPKRSIRYRKDGVYLINEKSEIICGPYKSIEIEDEGMNNNICRFIDNNGLMGYLSITDGEVVIPSRFVQASKMDGETAFVRDEREGYYINNKGERITHNEYLYGYPFSELQGLCARVQMPDGSFRIIDREENILLEGCEMIHELPGAYTFGSAVKDGKVIIFQFTFEEDGLEIWKQYDRYCDVSEIDNIHGIAVVENKQGLKGAICVWNSEVIIPAEYESLEIEYLLTEEEEKEIVLFKLKNKNDKYESVVWGGDC